MNKLKTTICAACTLMFLTTGTTLADSGNFAGPYIGLTGLAAGVAVDGAATESVGNVGTDKVTAGKATWAGGVEAGYALPLGSLFLLDIGASYVSGEAKLEHYGENTSARKNVSFKADEFITFYIAPTLALSDTSSLYVKVGLSEADTGTTGDITEPGDLRGETWAVGTRTVLDSGIFIRTEAGYTEYNGISAGGASASSNQSGAISNTTMYSAEPTIAYGQVSLGFRF